MTEESIEGRCLPCQNTQTRDWCAWNDLMPPRPNFFYVTGEVYVANPGVDPLLTPTEPQGINPRILLIDLYLCQRPGIWPQVFVWKAVRFEKKILRGYDEVQILCDGQPIATVPVEDVH